MQSEQIQNQNATAKDAKSAKEAKRERPPEINFFAFAQAKLRCGNAENAAARLNNWIEEDVQGLSAEC